MLATEKSMNTNWFESAKQAGTKGGEALPGAVTGERWYVLWTHSNSEQLVHQQLAAKGFQLFLPNIDAWRRDRKSTRLNSSHLGISYAVFCLKKKKKNNTDT